MGKGMPVPFGLKIQLYSLTSKTHWDRVDNTLWLPIYFMAIQKNLPHSETRL
jgi:hypothetical protein